MNQITLSRCRTRFYLDPINQISINDRNINFRKCISKIDLMTFEYPLKI
jgi:hypothetical protein